MELIKILDKVYDDYCKNNTDSASQEVMDALKKYQNARANYISAIIKESWINGFNYAVHLKLSGKRILLDD